VEQITTAVQDSKDKDQQLKTIQTSEPKWLEAVAKAYKKKSAVKLIDNAHLGIDPRKDTILKMGRKGSLSMQEWMAVLVSLGVAGAGAILLYMAIIDPEPFSKIALALATGAVLTFGGGAMAVKILTNVKPPKVKVFPGGFEISWD